MTVEITMVEKMRQVIACFEAPYSTTELHRKIDSIPNVITEELLTDIERRWIWEDAATPAGSSRMMIHNALTKVCTRILSNRGINL